MELTRDVVKYAHGRGVTVEGELGVLAGVDKSRAVIGCEPVWSIAFCKVRILTPMGCSTPA